MASISSRAILSRAAARVSTRGSLAAWSGGGNRMMTIGGSYKGKEKVEEERYIRNKEHEMLEAKRKRKQEEWDAKTAEEQAAFKARQKEEFDRAMNKTMDEVSTLLSTTGDRVSMQGLQNIAKWHLGEVDEY